MEPAQQPSEVASSRATIDPGMPSVILDLGDSVEDTMSQLRAATSPEQATPALIEAVLRQGEAILPALVREFPGTLWLSRDSIRGPLPPGRDVSALARAMVAFGDVAVPYVAALLDRESPDVRYFATLLAGEVQHRDLIVPLGRRLFDVDDETRALAMEVLRPLNRYPKDFNKVLERVRANARIPARPVPIRVAAIRALGVLRDERALDLLVRMLESDKTALAKAAQTSLVILTRQNLGSKQGPWLEWIDANRDRHRVEWLIDALTHDDQGMRRLAGEELKSLTKAYHGYHPGMPKRDREVSQRKYRDWWESEGRALFGV